MFNLSKKVAVITGGASGIGESTSLLFAKQGAHVHIIDLDEKRASSLCDRIVSTGGTASVMPCDVADQASVIAVTCEIAEKSGRIDILVNSAGIAHIGKVETTSEEDIDRLYRVNIKGVYNTMHAIVPHMRKCGGGVILNVCSVAGSVGITDRFAYSMTKGAVRAMTMSVARDYVDQNIRCNCLSPGRVHTAFVDGFLQKNYPGREKEMFENLSKTQPIGRMGKPEEIAALALYLCSDEASFVTGADYPIDGGFVTLNT